MTAAPPTPEHTDGHGRSVTVDVDGCAINVRIDGSAGTPLVLVHGGGGHTHWWDAVRRRLPAERHVALVDLSGHGDSGRRERYSMTTWAREVAAVVDAHAGGRAIVVAHSMGGSVGVLTAANRPDAVQALVLVDAAVPVPAHIPTPTVQPLRVYPTREEAVARFRLSPPQPAPPDALADVAEHSVVAVDGGWTWKFDPAVFAALHDPEPAQGLGRIACPVVGIYGEHSAVTGPASAGYVARQSGRRAPALVVPGAHHHLPLDAPGELADLLAWLPETRLSGDR